jgi:dihydrofolate reductase
MRTITYGGAVSLDGFLAGPNEELDWLHHSPDVAEVMREYWKDVDTILMGRKTYAFSIGFQKAQRQTSTKKKPERKPPKLFPVRTYVFSRTLSTIDAPGTELVTLVKSDAAEFVRNLKREPGKNICLMGGGELAQSLFSANLVDRIGLNIHPILLGSGIPTFRDPGHRVRLKLTESRTIAGGCILAYYDVLNSER